MTFEDVTVGGSMLAVLLARVGKQRFMRYLALAKIEILGWGAAVSEQVPPKVHVIRQINTAGSRMPFSRTLTAIVIRAPRRPIRGRSVVLGRVVRQMVRDVEAFARDWSRPVRRHTKRGGVWAMDGFESMARAGRDKWKSVEEVLGHKVQTTGMGRHRAAA